MGIMFPHYLLILYIGKMPQIELCEKHLLPMQDDDWMGWESLQPEKRLLVKPINWGFNRYLVYLKLIQWRMMKDHDDDDDDENDDDDDEDDDDDDDDDDVEHYDNGIKYGPRHIKRPRRWMAQSCSNNLNMNNPN